jgi:hypothetical protein
MTLRSLAGAFAIGLCASTAAAQIRPDFSGRWTVDSTALAELQTVSDSAARAVRAGGASDARPADDMGSGWGRTITIAQDADRLTVEYEFFTRYDMQPPLRFVFALDGSETKNSVNMGHGPQAQTSRTAWRGDTLVITTTHTFPHPANGRPMTSDVTRTLSLVSSSSLRVETVIGKALGGPPTTTRTIYRKISPPA